jgi:hypothetical protein
MIKGRDTRHTRSLLIGLFLLAILSVASAPGWATSGDWDTVVKDDFTQREADVFVGMWWEVAEVLNLLAPGSLEPESDGAKINGNLHVVGPSSYSGGGTVNIEYAEVAGFISVGEGAKVTIKGKAFAVGGSGKLDNAMNPTSVTFVGGMGTLTVTYAKGDPQTLTFLSTTQPVYLNTGGPDKIPVEVDIKPGSDKNVINPKSKGLVPVAIYTTDKVDATKIDPESIDLGGAKVALRGKSGKLMAHSEDVNGDGKADLMFQVELPNVGLARATSEKPAWVTGEVTLAAETFEGDKVEGSDKIVVVSDK